MIFSAPRVILFARSRLYTSPRCIGGPSSWMRPRSIPRAFSRLFLLQTFLTTCQIYRRNPDFLPTLPAHKRARVGAPKRPREKPARYQSDDNRLAATSPSSSFRISSRPFIVRVSYARFFSLSAWSRSHNPAISAGEWVAGILMPSISFFIPNLGQLRAR